MNAFTPADFVGEQANRKTISSKLLQFGNAFVDDSLLGILPDDLVLVGAPSGAGKTQFVVNIALKNLENGKRVHFFALEAYRLEIERRLKFKLVMDHYYSDPNRRGGGFIPYDEWEIGMHDNLLSKYEEDANKICITGYKDLNIFYKTAHFSCAQLIERTIAASVSGTDLIIIDHAHYFDWDDTNDNRAIKDIAKTCRDLVLENQIPIILVAHLRKKNHATSELVADLDEFHGSSDLPKIATKVITLASGGPIGDGKYVTFMRTPKNRHSSSSRIFLGRTIYDDRNSCYLDQYQIGWANAEAFGDLEPEKYPSWYKRTANRNKIETDIFGSYSRKDIYG